MNHISSQGFDSFLFDLLPCVYVNFQGLSAWSFSLVSCLMVMSCQPPQIQHVLDQTLLFLPQHSCLSTFSFINSIILSWSPHIKLQRHPNYFLFLGPNTSPDSIFLPLEQMVFASVISLSYSLPCTEVGSSFQPKSIAPPTVMCCILFNSSSIASYSLLPN